MSSSLYRRRLDLALPPGQSAFLWGARKVGKTTFLRQRFPNSAYYDLLKSDLFLTLLREPHRLREELLARNLDVSEQPVIIDEVQKVPALLDEVHWLIENAGLQFILCGSSARKLKRGQANLLGGRAWRFEMFPLVAPEIPDLDLVTALDRGLLPAHYDSMSPTQSLDAYVTDYLREEIQAEGLVRNLRGFAKFLDAAAFSNAELVRYTNIASDAGVDNKTVKEYFQILVDTHIGYLLDPFSRKRGRKTLTATPKFYFFDPGVATTLARKRVTELRGSETGKLFEQWVFLELHAHRSYARLDHPIAYWRTKTGLEVDFVLGDGRVLIEATLSNNVKPSDTAGLRALIGELKPERAIVVSNEPRARLVGDRGEQIHILPWRDFTRDLWSGHIIG